MLSVIGYRDKRAKGKGLWVICYQAAVAGYVLRARFTHFLQHSFEEHFTEPEISLGLKFLEIFGKRFYLSDFFSPN